jgi:hypothetical protein
MVIFIAAPQHLTKTIVATAIIALAMATGAQAASMKPMAHMDMKKPMHHMAMKKCHKGMMLMHGKCTMHKM